MRAQGEKMPWRRLRGMWARAGLLLLQAATCSTVVAPLARAQAERQGQLWIEAEKHLRACGSGAADTRRRCEANRQVFVEAYLHARRGDYRAQRSVARLLAASAGTTSAQTPSSAVIPSRAEACAWRIVIVHSHHVDPRDEARELRDCGRLTESERLAAELRASELLALITGAPAVNEPALPGEGRESS